MQNDHGVSDLILSIYKPIVTSAMLEVLPSKLQECNVVNLVKLCK